MRLKVHITLLFALGLAKNISAQDVKNSFYEEQARKDAAYEQSLVMSNLEDEQDFWRDQLRYENDLKRQDGMAYKIYMEEKKTVYVEHARSCEVHCSHSALFYKQAQRYFLYNKNRVFSEESIGSIVQMESSRMF